MFLFYDRLILETRLDFSMLHIAEKFFFARLQTCSRTVKELLSKDGPQVHRPKAPTLLICAKGLHFSKTLEHIYT